MSWWFQQTFQSFYDQGYTNVYRDVQREGEAYKEAGKQVATTVMQNAPLTGDANDAYSALRGKDMYTGKSVEGMDRWLAGGAAFVPGVSGGEVRAGKNTIKTILGEIKLSDHAILRMGQRGISKTTIQNTINKGEKFSYKNNKGQILTGFYDSTKQVFVGKGDQITTVINNVTSNYINNLKSTLGKK